MTADDTPDRRDEPTATADEWLRSEWLDWDRPSTALVATVAAVTDRDPTAMPPLSEHIDVDALDALMTAQTDDRTETVDLSFVYDGIVVRLDSDGTLDVQTDPG